MTRDEIDAMIDAGLDQYRVSLDAATAATYSRIRGMLGFTGSFKGKRVSVQGTGMGIP